ncbi:MAG: hypothetical protein AAGG55_06590 [Pseudomonadota bacterium]
MPKSLPGTGSAGWGAEFAPWFSGEVEFAEVLGGVVDGLYGCVSMDPIQRWGVSAHEPTSRRE